MTSRPSIAGTLAAARKRVREVRDRVTKSEPETDSEPVEPADQALEPEPTLDEQDDPRHRYSGTEGLRGGGIHASEAPILDFWRWAYSDFTDNVNRGVFAEWMVAKLLGADCASTRMPWDSCDIVTPEGIRVEVKATGYVQSWTQTEDGASVKPGAARFTRLRGRAWIDAQQTKVADEETFNADVYVFCLQANTDPQTWDALDLTQWQFYVLPRSRLEENGSNSIGISRLRQLTGYVHSDRLKEAVFRAYSKLGDH